MVKVAAKNINAKFFACEIWVKRVGTFGVVCIVPNDPLILFCILLNCILVVLSNTKMPCIEIIFSTVI